VQVQTGKAWELFGKLSLVLTIVATAIVVWKFAFPHAEEIEATGHYANFALPPNIVFALRKFREKKYSVDIFEYIEKENSTNNLGLSPEVIYTVSESLHTYIEKFWPSEFSYEDQPYSGLVFLSIENTGSKQAEKLVVDMPLEGLALITYQDEKQEVRDFSRKIEVGDLRPKNSVHLMIWSKQKMSAYDEEGFHVSYANGVTEFTFGKVVYGVARFFDDQKLLLGWLFSMFVLFVLISLVQSSGRNIKDVRTKDGEDGDQQAENESNN
jgi:hypothetical protein